MPTTTTSRQIVQQVRDPQLIEAILLIFAKLIMTTGIALLISTFATSSIFTIVTTFMIYLIGHMEGTAREFWLARRGRTPRIWQSGLVGFISLLIPDMNSFTIVDEILAGNKVPWSHTLQPARLRGCLRHRAAGGEHRHFRLSRNLVTRSVRSEIRRFVR